MENENQEASRGDFITAFRAQGLVQKAIKLTRRRATEGEIPLARSSGGETRFRLSDLVETMKELHDAHR